jgi:outer membrane murein-binding lipoprotein Lpp
MKALLIALILTTPAVAGTSFDVNTSTATTVVALEARVSKLEKDVEALKNLIEEKDQDTRDRQRHMLPPIR